MTFPAKGLPELVLAQPEGERLRIDRLLRLRHLHFDQTIDAARLGFGRSQSQQQLVARQLLALQFPKPSPQMFEPTLADRSEEHTSELQSQSNLVCRLLLVKKNKSC